MNTSISQLMLTGIMTVSLLGGAYAPGLAQTGTQTPEFVPGEVIVKMKTPETADAVARSIFGAAQDVKRTSGGELIIRLDQPAIRGLSARDLKEETLALVEELNQRDNVAYAQPNYIYFPIAVPDDPAYPDQWHYHPNGSGNGESPGGIGMPQAWDRVQGDPQTVIAVLDTGILPQHPDVQGSPNLIPGYDMISLPERAQDGDGRDADPTDMGDAMRAFECGDYPPQDRDDSWHGSHVAGTIGVGHSNNTVGIAGINWTSKVQAVRVLGKCGGSTTDIIDGIRWAAGLHVDGVPDNPTPAKVINMSLGGYGANCPTDDPTTQSAIQDAVVAGVTVVVAAGNDAKDAFLATPASCDNVIAVAASDARGHLVLDYSNFGNIVDIMAPGGNVFRDDNADGKLDGVLSLTQGGYKFAQGTSMAAPHVAGVAGLIVSEHPELLPGQVEARLKHDALPRNNEQCPKPCGAGLLQADFGVIVDGKADMGVRVDVDPETVKVTESYTYHTTLTNHGPSKATNGHLTATLPEGVTVLSQEFNHGSCSGETVITCDVDPMGNGTHARLSVSVKAETAGSKRFRAEVKADEIDEMTTNNVVSAVTQVTGTAPDPQPVLPVIPAPTKGLLDGFRDKNVYQFTLETPSQVIIETSGSTDVMMTLYGPNNLQTVLDQDLDSGEGANAKIDQELDAGTYYVEVRHQSIFGMGPYEIAVQQRN